MVMIHMIPLKIDHLINRNRLQSQLLELQFFLIAVVVIISIILIMRKKKIETSQNSKKLVDF